MKKAKKKMASDVVIQLACLVFSCVIGNAQGKKHLQFANSKSTLHDILDDLNEGHIKRILAIGDSVTEGYMGSGFHYYPYTTKLERMLNEGFNHSRFEVLNEGISANCSSARFVKKLPCILKREKDRVSFVLIVFGANEFRKHGCIRRGGVLQNILKLHEMCHKAGLTTVVATIPSCPEYDKVCQKANHRANQALRLYAKRNQRNTLLCDLESKLPLVSLWDFDKKVFWDDTVHPSRIGYDKLADLMFHTLMPAINERSKVFLRSSVH